MPDHNGCLCLKSLLEELEIGYGSACLEGALAGPPKLEVHHFGLPPSLAIILKKIDKLICPTITSICDIVYIFLKKPK